MQVDEKPGRKSAQQHLASKQPKAQSARPPRTLSRSSCRLSCFSSCFYSHPDIEYHLSRPTSISTLTKSISTSPIIRADCAACAAVCDTRVVCNVTNPRAGPMADPPGCSAQSTGDGYAANIQSGWVDRRVLYINIQLCAKFKPNGGLVKSSDVSCNLFAA